ncbi:MAG: carboxypeptidase-like regulatory domain-containing protein [Prolixibacteraceae bacterium]|nr:carboxypeptidase-like regulatory domain-containing protein [Prolixibacteraceae bacterium]
MKRLLIFILIIPFQLTGQVRLRGIIKDLTSQEPVEFASVYINGTTNGNITDINGKFTLENIKIPCQVIISHISYNTISFDYTNNNLSDTIIYLKLKDVIIPEISLKEKNRKEKNLKLFKDFFLGTDNWGNMAFIENENILHFKWDYDTIKLNINEKKPSFFEYLDVLEYIDRNIIKSKNDSLKSYLIPNKFFVYANEPLKIQLPLLGYFLQYDLQKFEMEFEYKKDFVKWKYLGYSYYQPIETELKSLKLKIDKNRKDAYYNSPQHLNKAFFSNSLRKNGYIVSKIGYDQVIDETYPIEIKPDSCWNFQKNKLIITGYKDINFFIKYYQNLKGEPINLTNKKGRRNCSESELEFLNDTCIFLSNGTIPDNSVLYKPFIGTKQIGATLPGDYLPSKIK